MKKATIWILAVWTAICCLGQRNGEASSRFGEEARKALEIYNAEKKSGNEADEQTLAILEEALVTGCDRVESDEDIVILGDVMAAITTLRVSLREEDIEQVYLALVGFGVSNFNAGNHTFGNAPETHPSISDIPTGEIKTSLRKAVELMKFGNMKEAEALLLSLYGATWYGSGHTPEELKYVVANKMGLYYVLMELPEMATDILRQNKIEMDNAAIRDRHYAEALAYLGMVEAMSGYENRKIMASIYWDVADAISTRIGVDPSEVADDYIACIAARAHRGKVYAFIETNDKEFFFLTEREREQRWRRLQEEWEDVKSVSYRSTKTGAMEGNLDEHGLDELLNAVEYEKQILLRSHAVMKAAISAYADPKALEMTDRLSQLKTLLANPNTRDWKELRAEYERVQKELLHYATAQGFDGRIYHPVGTAEIAAQLRDDETFIDFGTAWTDGAHHYFAILVTKDRPDGALVTLCTEEALHSHLGATETDDARRMVKARYGGDFLGTNLWRPLAESGMVKKKVLYSPCGELNSVMPDAILYEGIRLGETTDFHILSSVAALAGLRKGETYTPQALANFCAIDFYGDREKLIANAIRYGSDRPLKKNPYDKDVEAWTWHSDEVFLTPDSGEDYDWLDRLCGKRKIRYRRFSGESASEPAVKSLSGRYPGAINIYTHAFSFPEDVEMKGKFYLMDQSMNLDNLMGMALLPMYRTGLMLAGAQRIWCSTNPIDGIDDGVLNGEELSALDFSKVGVVTMLACETGRGDIDPYEGILGLRRALKLSGCGSIVSAAWKLDHEAAQTYLNVFYTSLLEGEGISASHRAAQLVLIRIYDDPYYWAVFQHVD